MFANLKNFDKESEHWPTKIENAVNLIMKKNVKWMAYFDGLKPADKEVKLKVYEALCNKDDSFLSLLDSRYEALNTLRNLRRDARTQMLRHSLKVGSRTPINTVIKPFKLQTSQILFPIFSENVLKWTEF